MGDHSLTSDELSFLRFCADEPRPTKFRFTRREAGRAGALCAVKQAADGEVAREIGPSSVPRIMGFFDEDMQLTASALLLLEGVRA